MRRALVLLALAAPLAGCQGWQHALDAHGPNAAALAKLFWIFLAILVVVWLATQAALLLALRRRRRAGADPLALDQGRERRMTTVVTAAALLTAVIVAGLTLVSYGAQSVLFGHKDGAVTVTVVGHQFWWELRYEDADPSRTFTTANELHVPAGEPVLLKLESSDVIHSFWVPNLSGKLDLIPGRQNQLQLEADTPGVYRGQCAEFCGWQHAHMGLLVVAEPRADFDRWRERQRGAAEPPADPVRQRGMEIFVSNACALCHSVRGTSAGGKVAPDLTHVGSRRFIAANSLENTRGNLAAWMVDPQGIKPGALMPTVPLEPDQVEPLARYLEGLK